MNFLSIKDFVCYYGSPSPLVYLSLARQLEKPGDAGQVGSLYTDREAPHS